MLQKYHLSYTSWKTYLFEDDLAVITDNRFIHTNRQVFANLFQGVKLHYKERFVEVMYLNKTILSARFECGYLNVKHLVLLGNAASGSVPTNKIQVGIYLLTLPFTGIEEFSINRHIRMKQNFKGVKDLFFSNKRHNIPQPLARSVFLKGPHIH